MHRSLVPAARRLCGHSSDAGRPLLRQERDDVLHVLHAIPARWRRYAFAGLRAPGGFAIGAEVDRGRVVAVTVDSARGGRLRLAHGLGAAWTVDGRPGGSGPLLETDTSPGQRLRLAR